MRSVSDRRANPARSPLCRLPCTAPDRPPRPPDPDRATGAARSRLIVANLAEPAGPLACPVLGTQIGTALVVGAARAAVTPQAVAPCALEARALLRVAARILEQAGVAAFLVEAAVAQALGV